MGTEIVIVNEGSIRGKIYEIRGEKVMLDFDLAEIYGYTTGAFNQQVKRNEDKFPADFRFRLSKEEFRNLKSQFVISSWGGARSMPWAFTEQGIYMLMTVLKGDLATQQSIALIRTFRAMKDYIVENRPLIGQHDYLRLSMQVSDTQQTVHAIQSQLVEHEAKFNEVFVNLNDTVKRSEIAPYLLDFSKQEEQREYLFLNGQPAKADETYIDIYSKAKHTVYIVDNYIDIKTLRLLQNVQPHVSVVVFSDNNGNYLHARDYTDFHTEFPGIQLSFQTAGGIMHDRFIVIDFNSVDEKMFHCGASSKDAGFSRITVISELTDTDVKDAFRNVVNKLLANPVLILR